MDARHKRLLDILFNLIVNSTYGFLYPKLPDNPKEAYERYSKLLKRRK